MAAVIVGLPAVARWIAVPGMSTTVAFSVAVGLLELAVLHRASPEAPSWPRVDRDLATPVVATSVLAAFMADSPNAAVKILGAQLAGLALLLLLWRTRAVSAGDASVQDRPGVLGRIGRANLMVDRVFSIVATAVSTVAFLALGVVVVLVPWIFQRIVRWDPTWFRRDRGSRFITRRVGSGDAGRRWTPDASLARVGWRRSLHRAGLVLAVPVILGGGLALLFGGDDSGSAPALASSTWWTEQKTYQFRTFDHARLSGFTGTELADVYSATCNVIDGRRQSWTPPPGAGKTVRVWLFGGSSIFGLGQRDDHTIPSELARVAHEQGIRLEVTNWGVHADVQWMEHRRLEAALGAGMARPDLVVFYDGFNDLISHTGPDNPAGAFLGALDGDVGRRFVAGHDMFLKVQDLFLPDYLRPEPPALARTMAESLAAAERQYRLSVEATRRDLEAWQIEGVFFHQPTVWTRQEPRVDEPGDWDLTTEAAAFRRSLPPAVVDLGGAFDRIDQPVYWDAVHTNEVGARVVATAMFDHLRHRLVDLTGRGR